MKRLAAAVLALVACTPVEEGRTGSPPEGGGWRIETSGDLNGFLDCIEAEGASLVSAHRGGPAPGYPENALETIAQTLANGPAVIEVDIATSADGVLYLMHDDRLERTTDGEGAAGALPWNQIAGLHLFDPAGAATDFAPPRFDEVLRWADGRTVLFLDIKRSTRYEDVAEEIHRQNAEGRVAFIAYTIAQARKLHRLAPEVMISLDVASMSDVNRVVAAGVPDHRIIGFTGLDVPKPRLFSILESRDVEAAFGTIGDLDRDIAATGNNGRYAEFAAMGADIIATDRPLAVQGALAAADRAAPAGACGISFARD